MLSDILSSDLYSVQLYAFHPSIVIPGFICVLVFVFSLVVLGLQGELTWRRGFFMFSFLTALGFACHLLALTTVSPNNALFWAYGVKASLMLVAVSVYHISVAVTRRNKIQRFFVFLLYAEAILFIVVMRKFLTLSPVLPTFALIFVGMCFIASLLNLLYGQAKLQDPDDRRVVRFWMVGNVIVWSCYWLAFENADYTSYLAIYILTLGLVISAGSLAVKEAYRHLTQKVKELHRQLRLKTQELEKINEELRETQLKLVETSKMSAVAALSAGILHQISQPITAIHGFVRFMKQEMKPENPFRKPVLLMDEQSVYLKEMLENLMNLIRHRKIKKIKIDLNQVVQRSIDLLVDELRIRRILWEFEADGKIPQIHADPVHLQQVFMNIIVNSIEALGALPPGKERKLEIVSEYDADRRQALIMFKDTGPGIRDAERDKIFEPFFSTKSKGTGIGLALCQDLVEAHGGSIDYEAQNEGAAFIVRLPVVDYQHAQTPK